MGVGWKIMLLCQLEGKLCTKTLKYGENWESGNPVVQIWQPWWPYTFLSASIGFLILENVGLASKIVCLDKLETKLWWISFWYGAELAIAGSKKTWNRNLVIREWKNHFFREFLFAPFFKPYGSLIWGGASMIRKKRHLSPSPII